ncbi:hypothetical protein CEXT_425071 [Caerostris extrusa]|uniref:Uncharacterized protein n=1 Tax=Caerostris extrusa TaxID=172846 RepID=A0AAV4VZG5_CAEEX|nr:hypothetical protein CEXT_425071 [Caerostris extrusa]
MLYCSGIQPGKDRTNSLALIAAWLTAAAGVKVISNKMKYCTNPYGNKYACYLVFRQQSNSSTGSEQTDTDTQLEGTEQSALPSHPCNWKRKRATKFGTPDCNTRGTERDIWLNSTSPFKKVLPAKIQDMAKFPFLASEKKEEKLAKMIP